MGDAQHHSCNTGAHEDSQTRQAALKGEWMVCHDFVEADAVDSQVPRCERGRLVHVHRPDVNDRSA